VIVVRHALIALLVAGLTSCAHSEHAERTPQDPARGSAMVVGEEANGHSFDVRQGSTIEIALAEKPGAGYLWSLRQPGQLTILHGKRAGEVSAGAAPGAGSTRTWKFVAAEPGETDLQFDYGRNWEAQPLRQFQIHVRVQAQ